VQWVGAPGNVSRNAMQVNRHDYKGKIVTEIFDQKVLNEFISLRNRVRDAKRAKQYSEVIVLCVAVLEIDNRARFLKILTPLFLKHIGDAYLKLQEQTKALEFFTLARDGYLNLRKTQKLNRPDDWLKDIEILEKKIEANRKITAGQ
jgi:hypothetical protein